jgi:hypothetical protein
MMMTLSTKKFAFLLVWTMIFALTLSCKKTEDTEDFCGGLTKLSTTMTINGAKENLIVAQLLKSNAGNDIYLFALTSANDNCLKQTTVQLTFEIAKGTMLNGTYAISEFGDLNEVVGSITKQSINPISQLADELESGTVKVTKSGTSKYDFDVNAKLVGGVAFKMTASHTF